MEIYENEWKSVKINENLWNPMEMEMEQGSARENAPSQTMNSASVQVA